MGATQAAIYTVGGTVQAGSGRYIARRADEELLALCRAGSLTYILTARQLGKSSLMLRTAERLAEEGIRSAQIDLALLGTGAEAEGWFFGLLFEIRRQLRLRCDLLAWWRGHATLPPTRRFSLFCEEVLPGEVAGQLVIFVDEIDTTLGLDFAADFFAAIRALALGRARDPGLMRLSFVLIGVATPGDLVRDPARTPFNIGRRVELADFSPEEARPLADGLGLPAGEARRVLGWVLDWTGGHPYLTQRLCLAVAEAARREWTAATVDALARATFCEADGTPDHNVQFVRDMLTKRAPDPAAVLDTYRAVRRARRPVPDEEHSLAKTHLKLSGVVRRERAGLRVRNRIYRTVFDDRWVREHLPVNWARQLRRAWRLVAILVALSLALGSLATYATLRGREAAAQQRLASARELTASALLQSATDPELGLLLALEAEGVAHTEEGEAALRQILLTSPLRAVLRAQGGGLRAIGLSADGGRVAAAGDDGTTRVWDANSGVPVAHLRGHSGGINGVAVRRDSRRIATAGDDGTARVWDAATDEVTATLRGHAGRVLAVAFSADGRRVATGGEDATARVWDADSGQPLATLAGHLSRVQGVGFSPDGGRLATASHDGTARVWDLGTGALRASLVGHTDRVYSAAFSPDGGRIVTASRDGTARIWEAASGQADAALRGQSGAVLDAGFSPDGRRVVTAGEDGAARLWDSASGEELAVLGGHGGAVAGAAFGAGGDRLVTASADGAARVWDLGRRPGTLVLPHLSEVTGAAFTGQGATVVTTSADGTARLWNARSGGRVAELVAPANLPPGPQVAPDGMRRLVIGADGDVQVSGGRPGGAVTLRGHTGRVLSGVFSPEGRFILTAGADGTARVWDAATGAGLAVLREGGGPVVSAAFSPDGRWIVTASDRAAHVYPWELFAPPDEVLALARARLTRNLTCAERQRYLHVATCT